MKVAPSMTTVRLAAVVVGVHAQSHALGIDAYDALVGDGHASSGWAMVTN